MLNLKCPVLEYRRKFKKDGYVLIQDLLEESFGLKVYDDLMQIPKLEWYHDIQTENGSYNTSYFLNPLNDRDRQSSYNVAFENYQNGVFSYSVKRTHFHREYLLKDPLSIGFFNTEEFKEVLTFISGYEIVTHEWSEINRAVEGDFVNEYIPVDKTSLTMSYNLTKDWQPAYGGMFYILEQDGKVKLTDYNTFNSILILDTKKVGNLKRHLSIINIKESINQRLCIDNGYGDFGLFKEKNTLLYEK